MKKLTKVLAAIAMAVSMVALSSCSLYLGNGLEGNTFECTEDGFSTTLDFQKKNVIKMTGSLPGYLEFSITGTYEASGDEISAKFTSIDDFKEMGMDTLASLSSAAKEQFLEGFSIEGTYELKKDTLTINDKVRKETSVLKKVKK